jgi:hypothetical protein
MTRPNSSILVALALVVPTLLSGVPVEARQEPDATVQIESTEVGAGVGVEWGDGILTLKDGSRHHFSVKGLDVADVGVSKVKATGEVYNLKDLEDFNGSYSAAQAGAAVGVGVQGAILQNNDTPAMIALKSTQEGLELSLAAGGVELQLKD